MTTIEALEAALINSSEFCILEKETVIDTRETIKRLYAYKEGMHQLVKESKETISGLRSQNSELEAQIRDELKKHSRYAEFPVIMGQQITREEIIEFLRDMYATMVKYEKISDAELVRFPDAETILDYIEENGLPPKL